MKPDKYFQMFAAAIVKRSGIARPTVEAVLPHVFDEIRYILTEGNRCVPIESFGTFAVIERPEHKYTYRRNDIHKVHTVPAKRVIRFAPTRNMRREVEERRLDPTRRSFTRHPQDPIIRQRHDMHYKPVNNRNNDSCDCQINENQE